MAWYHYDGANNLVLTCHVQTGAKFTEVSGFHGDALKIRLAAEPIAGKANAALLKFMAKQFGVPLSRVMLKNGEKSRHKVIVIQQPDREPDILLRY